MGNSRESIISSAIDLIYQYGYQKASIREICQNVGITQASLYYYFKNKEEILFEIIEVSSSKIFLLLKSCLSGDRDPIEKLKNAFQQHINAVEKNRKEAKIIIEDKRFLTPEIKELIKQKEKAIYNLYKNYLKEMQDLKIIKACNLSVATYAILAIINWHYHWYNPKGPLSINEIAKQNISFIFRGLLEMEK
ncbi:MAG: TetR family transcriptional regulator [Desulfobacterales bacterium]|nr:MAG: TetR family transcriptional regulator [Desulfobacterales bacterium]